MSLEAYARGAKSSELMDHAVEIRLLAERRAGEILAKMAERGDLKDAKDHGRES